MVDWKIGVPNSRLTWERKNSQIKQLINYNLLFLIYTMGMERLKPTTIVFGLKQNGRLNKTNLIYNLF